MIKNKVNPVAAEGTSSCEGVGEGGKRRKEGRERGLTEEEERAGGKVRRKDGVCSSQGEWGMGTADRWATLSAVSQDRKRGSLCTVHCFMGYVAECWWSYMMIGILLASLYGVDNECFIAPSMNPALRKVSHRQLNIAHALAFIHQHTRKSARTYIHCWLFPEAGDLALVRGGDYPKHRNERITKRWCNPAVNHSSLANIGFRSCQR